MAITRWLPQQSVTMRPFWLENWSPITRLMEDFLNDTHERQGMVWGPNVDVVENQDGFEIRAELPGVKPEDVKITLDNNVLTLSGEKRQEIKENQDNVLRLERSYGRFERSFSLPVTIKADTVRANFEDGVLHILLPKAEEAKTRQIQIESARR